MNDNLAAARPYTLTALRLALGLVIFAFGLAKIFGFRAGPFVPPPFSLIWFAGIIELVGGFAFLIGFKTRIVAFILSGQMAAAYFIAHLPSSFFPAENGGAAAAVFAFVFLYFVTAGPGPLSVDAALERRKH